jgi:hypothetical protein
MPIHHYTLIPTRTSSATPIKSPISSHLTIKATFSPHSLHPNQTPNHLRRIRIPAQITLILRIRIKERRHGNNDVRGAKQGALEIVGATVQHQEVDDESRDEEGDGFEEGEIQGHFPAHAPTEEDDEWSDEEGYSLLGKSCGKNGIEGNEDLPI